MSTNRNVVSRTGEEGFSSVDRRSSVDPRSSVEYRSSVEHRSSVDPRSSAQRYTSPDQHSSAEYYGSAGSASTEKKSSALRNGSASRNESGLRNCSFAEEGVNTEPHDSLDENGEEYIPSIRFIYIYQYSRGFDRNFVTRNYAKLRIRNKLNTFDFDDVNSSL